MGFGKLLYRNESERDIEYDVMGEWNTDVFAGKFQTQKSVIDATTSAQRSIVCPIERTSVRDSYSIVGWTT